MFMQNYEKLQVNLGNLEEQLTDVKEDTEIPEVEEVNGILEKLSQRKNTTVDLHTSYPLKGEKIVNISIQVGEPLEAPLLLEVTLDMCVESKEKGLALRQQLVGDNTDDVLYCTFLLKSGMEDLSKVKEFCKKDGSSFMLLNTEKGQVCRIWQKGSKVTEQTFVTLQTLYSGKAQLFLRCYENYAISLTGVGSIDKSSLAEISKTIPLLFTFLGGSVNIRLESLSELCNIPELLCINKLVTFFDLVKEKKKAFSGLQGFIQAHHSIKIDEKLHNMLDLFEMVDDVGYLSGKNVCVCKIVHGALFPFVLVEFFHSGLMEEFVGCFGKIVH